MIEEFKTVICTYALLIALGGNQLCCQVALHYLRSKPLGLQTFFDLVLTDFFGIFAIFSFHHLTFILIGLWFHHHVNWLFVDFVLILNIFLFMTFQFYITVIIIVKYLSIFHSDIINGIKDEKKILKRIRIGVFCAIIWYLVLVYNGMNVRQTFLYKSLTEDRPYENVTVPRQLQLPLFVNVILAIGLQLRKELDYWRYRENSGLISEIQNSRKKPERFFVIVAIVFIMAVFLLIPSLMNLPILRAYIQLLLLQVKFVLAPMAYILSSRSMAKYFVKIWSFWFPLFRIQNEPPMYRVPC